MSPAVESPAPSINTDVREEAGPPPRASSEPPRALPMPATPAPPQGFGDTAGVLRDQPLVQVLTGDGNDEQVNPPGDAATLKAAKQRKRHPHPARTSLVSAPCRRPTNNFLIKHACFLDASTKVSPPSSLNVSGHRFGIVDRCLQHPLSPSSSHRCCAVLQPQHCNLLESCLPRISASACLQRSHNVPPMQRLTPLNQLDLLQPSHGTPIRPFAVAAWPQPSLGLTGAGIVVLHGIHHTCA